MIAESAQRARQMSDMALFEERPVRRVFHDAEWWFVLTDCVFRSMWAGDSIGCGPQIPV